ncbi:ABC transporter substrate-binding protein [Bacillus sp. SD088]|uniref:ABC transporter substrate-binding protein n=1 Tax=Bacillus sp. SD088 TaxID=2782012 RepID=UPI001A96968B|nr:ABC transporter substrate-binding protein [Bacillus sp. SD088]MBO0995195.1 ABC transporter substrate-binding protein [Bacillus sp. SD088]
MLRKWTIFLSLIIVLGLVGCSSDSKKESEATAASTDKVSDKKQEMRTITHPGKEYEIPEKAERIVIVGAMESFEDSLVLDLHPVGASAIS